MAQTNYSKSFGKAIRAEGVMSREDYLATVHSASKRGTDLPQSKLTEKDIIAIRNASWKRDDLRKYIKDELSNEAIAKRYGVHVRNIEKILSYDTWSHVIGGYGEE